MKTHRKITPWWKPVLAGAVTMLVVLVLIVLYMKHEESLTQEHAQERAASFQCERHLQDVKIALESYLKSHAGKLPDAAHWKEQLLPYLQERARQEQITHEQDKRLGIPISAETSLPKYVEDVFTCPKARNTQLSYAFNTNVSNRKLEILNGNNPVVIVFESDHEDNTPSSPQLLPTLPRHYKQRDNYLVFLNGKLTIMSVTRKKPTEKLVWDIPIMTSPSHQ